MLDYFQANSQAALLDAPPAPDADEAQSLLPRGVYRIRGVTREGQGFCYDLAPIETSPRRVRMRVDSQHVGAELTLLPDNDGGVTECLDLRAAVALDVNRLSVGLEYPLKDVSGWRLHPLPFKIRLDGSAASRIVDDALEPCDFAEGWILENGEAGVLVMRLPGAEAETCFVPAQVVRDADGSWLQMGGAGPDGSTHKDRNALFERLEHGEPVRIPPARWRWFRGGWEEGVELYRSILESELAPSLRQYRPSPVTYNTFHDFGPQYSEADIRGVLGRLQELGIGMLHLDPGWETTWGSCEWDDATMGAPEDLVKAAADRGLQVGCWTSVHTRERDAHPGCQALTPAGEPYHAEEFGPIQLYGVCPLSGWRERFVRRMSRLARAGFRFINSDFHDWPWSGESCRSTTHGHEHPPKRTQWAEAMGEAFAEVRRVSPHLSIEMHDHVESGEYRTPVWYLYGRPGSYDEKWAYEFMWTTWQDLMDGKLFSLYHLRKAQPVPLFLHINMTGDSPAALAFWYVASCVNHIGIGGVLKASPEVLEGYRKAIGTYNRHQDAFTHGRFLGLDELTHIHVDPASREAVLLCFNLAESPSLRKVTLRWRQWRFEAAGMKPLNGAGELTVSIPPQDVRIIPLNVV